jgi:large subunit ribosomal protein L35
MPKMKTNKSAKKRLNLTGTGKIKRRKAYAGHLFLSKSSKRKRRLRQSDLVAPSDEKSIRRLLPYG